jgi:glucokinase
VSWPALIADIGGTNARFAVVEGPGAKPAQARNLINADYATLADAIEAYCAEAKVRPQRAAIAAAGPQTDGMFRLTNHSKWDVKVATLAGTAGLQAAVSLNDFEALALSLPHLGAADVEALKPDAKPVAGTPLGVAGPGTGLGLGAVVPTASGWQAIPGEGGHVELGHRHLREASVLDLVRREFGRVSAERVLCGNGLSMLHRLIGELDGETREKLTPAQITEAALAGDQQAKGTVEIFLNLLGSYAGDMALVYGSRGGMFIGGGIITRLLPLLDRPSLLGHFRAKGRLEPYLDAMPLSVITNPVPALIGCAAYLENAK